MAFSIILLLPIFRKMIFRMEMYIILLVILNLTLCMLLCKQHIGKKRLTNIQSSYLIHWQTSYLEINISSIKIYFSHLIYYIWFSETEIIIIALVYLFYNHNILCSLVIVASILIFLSPFVCMVNYISKFDSFAKL